MVYLYYYQFVFLGEYTYIISMHSLLTWAGKKIDPVGVDYILQKLGFQHARLTIPKWMQRGCMDPLDKVLSLLVNKLILVLKEQAENGEDDEIDD